MAYSKNEIEKKETSRVFRLFYDFLKEVGIGYVDEISIYYRAGFAGDSWINFDLTPNRSFNFSEGFHLRFNNYSGMRIKMGEKYIPVEEWMKRKVVK